jgi:hypothetical protein
MSGNVITKQILNDGPRNVTIKVTGSIDTSDVAASGTIGASGLTTTTGSPNITFVAGGLLPTLGQYVTFGDSAATFVAGTYIIAITDATHIVVSNNALKDNAAAAVTITGTAGVVVVLDPAKLSAIDNAFGTLPTAVRVDKVSYNVEATLGVKLLWEATANQVAFEIVNSGDDICAGVYGGITNNAGTGKTGKLVLSTQGWASSAVLSFTIILECVKQ